MMKRNVLALALASGLCFAAGIQAAPGDTGAAVGGTAAAPGTSSDQTTPAPAQSTDQSTNKDDKTKQTQDQQLAKSLSTITVSGYNQSMEKSIDYQRYADTIQNVITSADIGGLPDHEESHASGQKAAPESRHLPKHPGIISQHVKPEWLAFSGESDAVKIPGAPAVGEVPPCEGFQG